MTPIRIVQSKQNGRVKELRRALTHPGRDSGPAGIEGPNLIREAIRARLRIESIFVAQGAEALLEELDLSPETDILAMPRDLLAAALATETPQLVAALVEPPQWSWNDLFTDAAPLIVVLAGLQDPGNLGTILRSAEAFGASGVIALPGTVSAWNPKAVRASAGSVLRMPLLAADETEAFAHLRHAGVRILAAAVRGAQPASAANLAGPVALLIGNEGNGLPPELAAQADGAVTIPCPGPVESLNAAVAASVLLYEASHQRGGSASNMQERRNGPL